MTITSDKLEGSLFFYINGHESRVKIFELINNQQHIPYRCSHIKTGLLHFFEKKYFSRKVIPFYIIC